MKNKMRFLSIAIGIFVILLLVAFCCSACLCDSFREQILIDKEILKMASDDPPYRGVSNYFET